MPGRYFPYALKHYTPVMRPMPVPGIEAYDECPAVCVRFSQKLVPYLLGLLEIYRWRDNFEGTDEEIDTALGVVQDLMVALQEACVCCCDDEKTPTNQRINPITGKLEQSFDGGETWETVTDDWRFNGMQLPPLPGAVGDAKRCQAASNVLDGLQETVSFTGNLLTTGATVSALIEALIGFVLVLLSIPVTGGATLPAAFVALIALLTAVAQIAISSGAAAYNAAFTAEVWDTVFCILYCNTPDNGIYTEADWQVIKNQITSEVTDVIASSSLEGLINGFGVVGLNNVASSRLAALGDCESCDCDPEWCYEFDFLTVDGSFVNVSGSNYGNWSSGQGWVSETVPGSGGQSIWIKRDFVATITRVEIDVTWTNTSGRNIQVNTQDTQLITDVGSAPLSHTFTWDGLRGATQLVLNPSGGAGNVVRITRLLVRGTGTNPFGADNCA